MILSMWTDDEKLSTSKNQLWYSAIWLLFINIPGSLFSAFYSQGWELNQASLDAGEFVAETDRWNLFVNNGVFQNLLFNEIVRFLEITIFGIATIVIILAGYKILLARGKDEDISEARTKILYGVIALFFVGFIEALKRVAFTGNLTNTWWFLLHCSFYSLQLSTLLRQMVKKTEWKRQKILFSTPLLLQFFL